MGLAEHRKLLKQAARLFFSCPERLPLKEQTKNVLM
jgi:hypothetical protein